MSTYLCWDNKKAGELVTQGNKVYSLLPIKEFLKHFIVASKMASSMAEARRLLSSGAIDIDGRKIEPNSQFVMLERGD